MNILAKSVLLALMTLSFAIPGLAQIVTGNVPASDEDLKKLSVFEPSPTSAGIEQLPSMVDNSGYLEVSDQVDQGSCTAYAVASALSMLASNLRNEAVSLSPYYIWDAAFFNKLSINGSIFPPIDNQYCSNWRADSQLPVANSELAMRSYRLRCRDCDCGLCSKGGISIPQALYESRRLGGVPLITAYPKTSCGKFAPNDKIVQKMAIHSSTVYRIIPESGVNTLPDEVVENVKSIVSQKLPVIIGLEAFFDKSYNGQVLEFDPELEAADHHAMTVVGYDEEKVHNSVKTPSFKVINSWGMGWGDRGYLWISFDAFKKMVKEVYVVSPQAQSDSRDIRPGNTMGKMRFELSQKGGVEGQNTDICLDANTYTRNDPIAFQNEVIAYRCHNGENQIWTLVLIEEPNKYLIKADNGKYLTVIDDKVWLDTDESSPNAHWLLEKSLDKMRYVFRLDGRAFVLGVNEDDIKSYSDKTPPSIKLDYWFGQPNHEWNGKFLFGQPALTKKK